MGGEPQAPTSTVGLAVTRVCSSQVLGKYGEWNGEDEWNEPERPSLEELLKKQRGLLQGWGVTPGGYYFKAGVTWSRSSIPAQCHGRESRVSKSWSDLRGQC